MDSPSRRRPPLAAALVFTFYVSAAGAQANVSAAALPAAPVSSQLNSSIKVQTAGPAWTSPSALAGPLLTLAQAEATAISDQPELQASQLRARAAREQVSEQAAARLPTVVANATGILAADTGTATAAGALTTSSISDRFAYGGTLSQLVTDFGRTSALVGSQQFSSRAAQDQAVLTQAAIRLNVRSAYYQVLSAEAVLRFATEAQQSRALLYRQVSQLAASQLRSTLDVNFAGVLESQAELAVVQARALVQQQRARLATAMGAQTPVTASLVTPALPAALPPTLAGLLQQADRERADLEADRDSEQAADRFATAQHRLSYPTLNLLGAAGQLPYHDHTLQGNYAAAGFNLRIPVFNGGLFHDEQQQAAFDAAARTRDTREKELEVNEQVRDAWFQAQEAFESLGVTARLVQQSREALRLAQARYDADLGSIVELNEAQLNETSSEITAAAATYTYLSRRAALDYATGQLN